MDFIAEPGMSSHPGRAFQPGRIGDRELMADPGYVNGCNHCNRCVARIDEPGGIRCPLNDVPAD